jgi:hypothetical protein
MSSKRARKNSKRIARKKVVQRPRTAPTTFARKHLHPNAPTAVELRKRWRSYATVERQDMARALLLSKFPLSQDTPAGAAREAWTNLFSIHETLRARLEEIAASRGTAEWLFFLRRLRGQFAGLNSLDSTEPYVQRIAEAVVTRTVRESEPVEGDPTFTFYVTPELLSDLMKIHEGAGMLYDLHSAMKRCAKGHRVLFAPGDRPRWVDDQVLGAAIRAYDLRTEHDETGAFAALGIRAPELEFEELKPPIGSQVLLWRPCGPRPRGRFELVDPPPYGVVTINLDALRDVSPAAILDEEQVCLIALLMASVASFGQPGAKVKVRMLPPFQWGYHLTHIERTLLPYLDATVEAMRTGGSRALEGAWLPGSGAEVLEVLGRMETEVYAPLSGDPVHLVGDKALIDLASASDRLIYTLRRPRDGPHAQPWADRFEEDVQARIDASEWRPEGVLRDLIGKVIKRRDGSTLTDVDAVAMRGEQLLLVSCKSLALTREIARGEFAATRNAHDRAHEYLAEWNSKTGDVRDEPGLLGVALPTDCEIDGCVVYPTIPYFTDPDGRRLVFGHIPALLSISELGTCLGR